MYSLLSLSGIGMKTLVVNLFVDLGGTQTDATDSYSVTIYLELIISDRGLTLT